MLVLGAGLVNGFELVLSEDNSLVAIVAYFGLLQRVEGFATRARDARECLNGRRKTLGS